MEYRVGLQIKKRRRLGWWLWFTIFAIDFLVLAWFTLCVYFPSVLNLTINAIYGG